MMIPADLMDIYCCKKTLVSQEWSKEIHTFITTYVYIQYMLLNDLCNASEQAVVYVHIPQLKGVLWPS